MQIYSKTVRVKVDPDMIIYSYKKRRLKKDLSNVCIKNKTETNHRYKNI